MNKTEGFSITDQLYAKAAASITSNFVSDKMHDDFEEKLDKAIYHRLAALRMTPQQRLISSLLIKGMNNRAVAGTLFIEEKTVKFHITKIYKALGLNGTHDRNIGYSLMKIRQEEFDRILRETVEQDFQILKEAVITIIRKGNITSDEYKICDKAWKAVLKVNNEV